MIHCLMLAGGALDEGIRLTLYLVACDLIRSRERYKSFTDEIGSGGVSTEGQRATIGSLSGISFTATVDLAKGRTIKCSFIVRDVDMPGEEEVLGGAFRWHQI